MTIPGTPRCDPIKPTGDGPYTVACQCGWSLCGRSSKRDCKRQYHRHLRFVKASR